MEVRQVQDLGEGRPRGRGRGDEGGGGVEGGAVQRPVGGAGGAGGAAGPQHHAADVAAGEGVLQHGAVTSQGRYRLGSRASNEGPHEGL